MAESMISQLLGLKTPAQILEEEKLKQTERGKAAANRILASGYRGPVGGAIASLAASGMEDVESNIKQAFKYATGAGATAATAAEMPELATALQNVGKSPELREAEMIQSEFQGKPLTADTLNAVADKLAQSNPTRALLLKQAAKNLFEKDKDFDAGKRAEMNIYNEFVREAGGDETEGSQAFAEWKQGQKEAVAAASRVDKTEGLIFKEELQKRIGIEDTISKVNETYNLYSQAKAGSSSAGKLAENSIQEVFNGKARAQSEIARIASAGGFVENVGDFVNEFMTGTKTAGHYDNMLKVLESYRKENFLKFNKSTDNLIEYNNTFDMGIDKDSSLFKTKSFIKEKTENDKEVYIWKNGKLVKQ